MDNTAAQRFDGTKLSERKPFRNLLPSNRPSLLSVCAIQNTITHDSVALNLLKGSLSEYLVLSNHSRLLSVLHMDNRAAQRFDSTEFSERKPFRKFDAVEPPFAVLIVGKRSGSIAPTFF